MGSEGVRRTAVVVALLGAVLLAAGTPASGRADGPAATNQEAGSLDDTVRLNQIQYVASHNSYHLQGSQAESDLRRQFIGEAEERLLYEHAPIPEQFASQKVRGLELDLFVDRAGGKYANPLIRTATGGGPYDPAMNEPGIKVLHVQDVDYRSSCLSLKACLQQVEDWSAANPDHVPIAIQLELTDSEVPIGGFPFVIPDPWNAQAMDELDAEIRSVVPESEVITPDEVRGGRATLDEAVRLDGWPTLAESRGKVLFLMDNGGSYRDTYLAGHPALQDRVVFTNSLPGAPDGGFVKANDARNQQAAITDLVTQGYIVRTRADVETIEASENDTSARDAAFPSGAHYVSTDFPVPEYAQQRYGTDFVVQLPGNLIARCNPVNAPPVCDDQLIEVVPGEEPPITEPPTTPPATSPPTVPAVPPVPPVTPPAAPPAPPVTPLAAPRPPAQPTVTGGTAPVAVPIPAQPTFTG